MTYSKYKLVNNENGETMCIKNYDTDTGPYLSIPLVEANTDYQKYLEWVSEGGVAEAAD